MSGTITRIDPTKPSGPNALTSDIRANDIALQGQIDALVSAAGSATRGATGEYQWAATPPPQSGEVSGDNADQTLITTLQIDRMTADGFDASGLLGLIKAGDVLYLQDKADANTYRTYDCTGAAVPTGSLYAVAVSYRAGSTQSFADSLPLMITLLSGAASAVAVAVTGSRSPGGTALASLIDALAARGLIIDRTTG